MYYDEELGLQLDDLGMLHLEKMDAGERVKKVQQMATTTKSRAQVAFWADCGE